MSPIDQLLNQLVLWRHWTGEESAALASADWPNVARCQQAKAGLQPAISAAKAALDRLWASAASPGAHERAALRAQIDELMAKERENQAILDQLRQRHIGRRNELASTSRNLRKVQRSYVSHPTPAWQSYS